MFITDGASAVNVKNATTFNYNQASCDLPPQNKLESSIIRHRNQGILVASAEGISGDDSILNFSAAESDAAAVLFGCDCAACISALRQLRSQSLLNNVNGHCWSTMQERVSPQTVQEVLQDLEAKEAEQKL